MDQTLKFNDIIKKSVLESGQFLNRIDAATMLDAAITVIIALALGFVIYVLYRASFRGVVYSEAFAITLIGMTVLTAGIIVTIQSNVVLSLGMVGALSIVRYRTAIKSPMDLMFLFWTVGVGIATGAGMYYIAVLISVIMALLLFMVNRKGVRDNMYVLIIHYTGVDISAEIRRAIGTRYCVIQSQTIRKNDVEMAVEIRVKSNNQAFLDNVRAIESVTDVTLVRYDGDYIG